MHRKRCMERAYPHLADALESSIIFLHEVLYTNFCGLPQEINNSYLNERRNTNGIY